jgi:hypothetical protein
MVSVCGSNTTSTGISRIRAWGVCSHSTMLVIMRGEARHRAMMNDVAVQLCLAAGLGHRDFSRGADWAERPRREIHLAAFVAALQQQLFCFGAVPEMLGFGGRLRHCAPGCRHLRFLPSAGRLLAVCWPSAGRKVRPGRAARQTGTTCWVCQNLFGARRCAG